MMQRYSPARIEFAASITALSDEPQTLLIVTAGVESGKPAPNATWRAGAWPAPACNT